MSTDRYTDKGFREAVPCRPAFTDAKIRAQCHHCGEGEVFTGSAAHAALTGIFYWVCDYCGEPQALDADSGIPFSTVLSTEITVTKKIVNSSDV